MAQQKLLNARIKWKRDSASNWEFKDPVLLNGEIIIVDTAAGDIRFKVGDGTKKYSQLPFTDEGLKQDISSKQAKITANGILKGNNGTISAAVAGTDYAAASHTHNYLPLAGGTMTGPVASGALEVKAFSGGGNGYSTNGWVIYKKDGDSTNSTTAVQIHDKTYTNGTERFELEVPKVTAPAGFVGNLTGNVTGNASTATALQSKSIGSATKPVYFDANGKPVAISHTIESDVPANAKFTDTNTTYTASNGVTLTGTNFTNSGVRAVSKGTTNGTISVNTNGTAAEVAVAGLGSAAYTASTAYTPAAHATNKSNPHNVTASQVGAIPTSQKGAKNGVAELDANGFVPSSQLPSYVDDVLEYTAKANFPKTGETGKIYVDKTTNLTWRWGGTAYVEISPSLAIGMTSSTAFRGDYGNTAYTHAVTNKGKAFTSGLYKIMTNAEGHVTAATAVTKSDIVGLGIPSTNTTYEVMGAATASAAGTKGLVPAPAAGKQASFLRGDGTWAVPTDHTYSDMTGASASAAGTHGLVPAPAAGKNTSFLRGDGTWVVPTNTTYTAGAGLALSSNKFSHSNSVTAKTAYGSAATTASANGGSIVVTDIKYDAQGHITGSTDRTIKLSQTTYTLAGLMGSTAKGSATQPVYWNGTAWTNTTYTLGKSVPSNAKFTDTVYSLPTASSTLGGVKTTSTVTSASGYTACPIIDGVVYYKDTNNTYTLAGLMGSTAKGNATTPVYWDGTNFKTITSYSGEANTAKYPHNMVLASSGTKTSGYWNPFTWTTTISWTGFSGIFGLVDCESRSVVGIFSVYLRNNNNFQGSGEVRWLSSSGSSVPTISLTKVETANTSIVFRLYIDVTGTYRGYHLSRLLWGDNGATITTSTGIVTSKTGTALSSSNGPNQLTINGKTYNGSAAVDAGTIGIAYGGTGATSGKAAIHNIIRRTKATSKDLNDCIELGTYIYGGESEAHAPYTNAYGTIINITSDGTEWNKTNNWLWQINLTTGKNGNDIFFRKAVNNDTLGNWRKIVDSINYTDYTVKKDGTGATGTWAIDISKNAATATKLATARTIKIGNQSLTFDGTKDITFTTAAMGITTTSATIHRYSA